MTTPILRRIPAVLVALAATTAAVLVGTGLVAVWTVATTPILPTPGDRPAVPAATQPPMPAATPQLTPVPLRPDGMRIPQSLLIYSGHSVRVRRLP